MSTAKAYRIARVSDSGSEIQTWRQRGLVCLAGSLVSTYIPTSFPNGADITEGLWNFIFGDSWPPWLKRDFKLLPFEALMQCYPDRSTLPRIVTRLFQNATPNLIHKRLGAGLIGGTIEGLITTNYDTAFETCVAGRSEIRTITTHEDADAYRSTPTAVRPRSIFKIHGTALDGMESTLVCDLNAEGRIPRWKRELLLDLVGGRTVVVIGYSGRDFDICPELADAEVAVNVIWLQRSRRNLQPSAERVLEKRRGLLMIGDLLPFLGVITGESISAGQPIVNWRADGYFDCASIPEWRRRILDWIACPTLLKRLPIGEARGQIGALVEHAALAGHVGRYYSGACKLQQVVRIPGLSRGDRLSAEITAAESWFIYGRYWRAWRMLRHIELRLTDDPVDDHLHVLAAELRMMMNMRVAQLAERFHLMKLQHHIRHKSLLPYGRALPALENKGAWRRLATLRQNAERIGIAGTTGLPLPAAKGYASLGLISMDVIAKRDWIRSGEMTPAKHWIANCCIRKAEQYGWDHEAWKFHWILLWSGLSATRHFSRTEHFFGWLKHFWKTQYPPLGRMLQLLNNFPRHTRT